MKEDTIAAIATGMTDSGIGIIRISGEDAVAIGDRIFRSPSGKRILKKAVSHMLYGSSQFLAVTVWNGQHHMIQRILILFHIGQETVLQ